MNNVIITSEIDKDYFIINSGVFYLTCLKDLINKKNNAVADELSSINKIIHNQEDFIFVKKESKLGDIINNLLEEKELIDGNQIIKESHLINCLINQSLNNNDLIYLKTISKMIKNNDKGLIKDLKEIYPEHILKEINKEGRYIWASSKNENNEKYYKEIYLHGYQSNGITYCDNRWFYIDIVNKCMTPVKINNPKQKIKTNEN